MGIGPEDLRILIEYGKKYNIGKKCAILGDCTFWRFKNASKDEFKRIMNFDEVHTFDINGNPDFKLDLQEDCPVKFKNYYDCVLDVGTLYSCFDVVSVWKNILFMLNSEGCIWHQTNLVGHFGRGFWSFSPSVFNEFYTANNFKDIDLKYLFKSGPNKEKWQNISPNCNYLQVSNESSLKFVNHNCTVRHRIMCDTALSCFVKRNGIVPFKKPIPEHYIKTNGK
jgi:hypothetical protein